MTGNSVVLVAPYTPGVPVEHLGAAKKIELVIKLLSELGFSVHLVDSAHHRLAWCGETLGKTVRVGSVDVTLWSPFCLPNRKLGKLFNIFFFHRLLRSLAFVKPELVWLYNSYAFEASFGMALSRQTGSTLVLELEDLPLSRGRGLNPKPYLDEFYFKRLLPVANLITFVNASLMRRFSSDARASLLLPSVLSNELVELPAKKRFEGPNFRLGYFGGLEIDKGVGVLTEIVPLLLPDWTLVVTGVGKLAEELKTLQYQYPDRIEFHGAVSHEKVIELMGSCDAIVNPHAPIENMHDGVFPFKVCEALASGALLITTPLPSIDIDLAAGVIFFNGTVRGLQDALLNARSSYFQVEEGVAALKTSMIQTYGERAIKESFRGSLRNLGCL